MQQLMDQPQTKSYSEDFNLRAADVMLEAQRIMHGEGFNVTFAITDADGMSYDSGYVKNQIRGFFRGKQESAHTDANHNANNSRGVSC